MGPYSQQAKAQREHGSTGSTGRDQITDNDRAMLQLKVAKTRLVKHRAGIARTIEREAAAARHAATSGDRLRARDALRKRRYWELTLEKSSVMMGQQESVIAAIELAQLNKVVYEGLRSGTTALKQTHLELSAFDVSET